MEDIQRKSRKDPQMLPDHDRDKTPIADKIANQIIDSVRTVSTTPPKSAKKRPVGHKLIEEVLSCKPVFKFLKSDHN